MSGREAGSSSAPSKSPAGSSPDIPLPPPVTLEIPRAKTEDVVNYLELPPPVRYEELMREAVTVLKPEVFEGLRFEFAKPLNQNFGLTHSIFMGNIDVPSNQNQVLKIPMSTYTFGANLVSSSGNMLIGQILTDGRLQGRAKYDLNSWCSAKGQVMLVQDEGMSQCMFDLDMRRKDWNGQIKLGNNHFYGLNYFQAVTPTVSLGGEAFWLANQMKSGVGIAGRYAHKSDVATCQVATTGLVSLTYAHKISDKVSLATDFMWNWNAREAEASFGYDYILRQSRLRGKIDTHGRVAAYLEERINVGVSFLLSAEIDHFKKDYKFGFGMTLGE